MLFSDDMRNLRDYMYTAKTLFKAGSFLNEKPELKCAKKIEGTQGNLDALLELLKGNVLPTNELVLMSINKTTKGTTFMVFSLDINMKRC